MEQRSFRGAKTLISELAEDYFRQGYNCCESTIKATVEILKLPLPEDIYLMGKYFQRGVAGSGCICGALAGGIMMLGYISGRDNGVELAEEFRAGFVEKFGSTCCRVIRKKQSITGRLRNKECRDITGFAASMLQQINNSDKG